MPLFKADQKKIDARKEKHRNPNGEYIYIDGGVCRDWFLIMLCSMLCMSASLAISSNMWITIELAAVAHSTHMDELMCLFKCSSHAYAMHYAFIKTSLTCNQIRWLHELWFVAVMANGPQSWIRISIWCKFRCVCLLRFFCQSPNCCIAIANT